LCILEQLQIKEFEAKDHIRGHRGSLPAPAILTVRRDVVTGAPVEEVVVPELENWT
jgi:hypothetical protein